MSIVETILVFVAAPAAIVAVIAVLIFAPRAARAPRYRPGREWTYQPVWYAPHPLAVHDYAAPHSTAHDSPASDAHGDQATGRTELTAGALPSAQAATEPTAAGGARGTW